VLTLLATAAFGLESVVERELHALGYKDTKIENGRVAFRAPESAVARANLWLRSADRLLIEVGVFEARTFDELFENTKALCWHEWLPEDACFPVTGSSVKSQLRSVPDCQAIVKKAIVESLRKTYPIAQFAESGGLYRVHVSIIRDRVSLTLDTTGDALHKRGYRKVATRAPIKETLAAGLIMLSRWKPDRPFADPFCGSGTIPIEAALIGLNVAPGKAREFAAEHWPRISSHDWQAAREESQDALRRTHLDILGSDIDPAAVDLAEHTARLAGIGGAIRFKTAPAKSLRVSGEYGCLVTNPPYGQRLGESRQALDAYRELAQATKPLKTWSLFVLTAHPRFESVFGRKAQKRRRLYNARIECTFYQYLGPFPPYGALR